MKLTANDVARFWSKMHRPESGCWEWKAKIGKNYPLFRVWRGYGPIALNAHRIALWLKLGENSFVCATHSCDNKRCVRPTHLRAGTFSTNTKEAYERGLLSQRKGPKNG